MNEEIILNVESYNPYVIGAVAYVEQLENGAKITIVDKNGTTTATVEDGKDGKSISSIVLNDNYTLTINYEDGSSTTTGSIRGATGASGVFYGEEEPIDPAVNVWVDPADGDGSVLKIRDEDDQWATIESIVGEPAGFGTVTATVDANHGTPAVTVTTSGDDTAKNFAFAFSNLQPAPYDDSELQADFATLQGQFDTAVAAVTTDTEVTDIRVGADGITDTTAGASVRRQFSDLKSDFNIIAEKTQNLWNKGDVNVSVYKTIPFPLEAGTYTISGVATSTDTDSEKCAIAFSYIPSGAVSVLVERGTRFSETVTLTGAVSGLNFYASSNYSQSAGDTASFTDIQIEAGSSATPYAEPYIANDTVARKMIGDCIKKWKFSIDLSSCDVGYLYNNGTISGTEGYLTTDFIPVEKDCTYKISRFRKFMAYDNAKAMISDSYVNDGTYNYSYTPSADGYIRFSFEPDLYIPTMTFIKPSNGVQVEEGISLSSLMKSEVESIVESHLDDSNVLKGKVWYACGDSFTDYTDEEYQPINYPQMVEDLSYKAKTYPFWIGTRNGMKVHNIAVSGQTLATPSDGTFTNAFSCDSLASNYKSIPSDADYITIRLGINDSNHASGESGVIPIGTIDDNTINTFYGAWNVVLEYLIRNHPYAHIGIIVTNGAGTDYVNATIACAKKWGIAYLNLDGDYQVPLMQRTYTRADTCALAKQLRLEAFSVDLANYNTHTNVAGHKYESTFIEAWMRSI